VIRDGDGKVIGNNIRIIFMDCEMPVLNGYDATQRIRQMELSYLISPRDSVQICGLSGNDGEAHQRKCK
jgi:CheY-like chemotaxis protein